MVRARDNLKESDDSDSANISHEVRKGARRMLLSCNLPTLAGSHEATGGKRHFCIIYSKSYPHSFRTPPSPPKVGLPKDTPGRNPELSLDYLSSHSISIPERVSKGICDEGMI
jgi:hypothetical protein